MSVVRCKNRITNKEVRRRRGMENLEQSIKKTMLKWFGHVKLSDENSIFKRAMELK